MGVGEGRGLDRGRGRGEDRREKGGSPQEQTYTTPPYLPLPPPSYPASSSSKGTFSEPIFEREALLLARENEKKVKESV